MTFNPGAGEGGAGKNSIRKPMLYPVSYESVRYTFVLDKQRISVRWARLATSLPPVYAAPVPRPDQLLITRSQVRG